MRRGIASGIVVAGAMWLASTAQAATIDVTTPSDPGPAGTTSLRQAIAAAGTGDTVSVPAGRYTLAMGQITVPNAITISGAGASSTVIDANRASRTFDVTNPSGTTTISGVTVTNGSVDPMNTSTGGGAILATGTGSLSLSDDAFTGNTVAGTGNMTPSDDLQGGGAIYSTGHALSISGSTFSQNSANLAGTFDGNGGGAIFYDGATPLMITGSTVTGNTFQVTSPGAAKNNGGGAIYDDHGGATISGSTVDGNQVSLSSNSIDNGGGGVYDTGNLTLADSSVSGNQVTLGTGGVFNGGGGIRTGGLAASDATIASNSLTIGPGGGDSGGGGVQAGALTLVNVTLSDNSLTESAGVNNGGGGLYWDGTTVGTITNTTIADNTSNQAGGALFSNATAALTFKSTIAAANSASSGSANCAGSPTPTSAGYNLEDTTPSTCGLSQATDVVGKAAGLGPLQDNGGPGPTHALLPGSPAIDLVPAAQCTDQQTIPQPVSTDERGVPRATDGFCDIGAYEVAPADLRVNGTASPTSIVVSQGSTATFTVSNSGPAPATATTLSLTLPAGLKLVSATPSQGSCSGTTCTLGLLASAASAQVTVAVTGSQAGSQSLVAHVSATEPDPTPADNATAVTIDVSAPQMSKLSVKPKSFKKHAVLSYTLNVAGGVKFRVELCTRSSGKHHRLRCKKRFSFMVSGSTGANHFGIKRRLRGHTLEPGDYKLVATPTVAGQNGASSTASFRIL